MACVNYISHQALQLVRRPVTTKWVTLNQVRNFTKSTPRSSIDLTEMHKPTKFQRKILVWAGTFKSMDEVPERVRTTQLTRAMDLFRIRVNIGMVIGTVCLFLFAGYQGRKLRESGETLDRVGARRIENWERQGEEERARKE